MKTVKTITAAELDEKLSAITHDPTSRGAKTRFLDQHAGRIEAALRLHTYEQVARAIGECGLKIAPATISNWRKQRRAASANQAVQKPDTHIAIKTAGSRAAKSHAGANEPTDSLFPSTENDAG